MTDLQRQYYSVHRGEVHEFGHPYERNAWVARHSPDAHIIGDQEASRLLRAGWACYSHSENGVSNVVVMPNIDQRRANYARHLRVRSGAAFYFALVIVLLAIIGVITMVARL